MCVRLMFITSFAFWDSNTPRSCLFLGIKSSILSIQRWEFQKEKKKVRKKKENTFSTKKATKKRIKKKKVFCFFSWSLTWSMRAGFFLLFLLVVVFLFLFFLDRFLCRERVFLFFLVAFLVESVFSCFLTLLFSFMNSHLLGKKLCAKERIENGGEGREGVGQTGVGRERQGWGGRENQYCIRGSCLFAVILKLFSLPLSLHYSFPLSLTP